MMTPGQPATKRNPPRIEGKLKKRRVEVGDTI
jgi:hypothetical protein